MATEVATLKIATVREFRDRATGFLRSTDPILITRRGRLAGIFFPQPESSLPIEMKKEIFPILSAEITRQLRQSGTTEDEILADFGEWRTRKREARRRR